MKQDDSNGTIDGYPVKYVDTMPEDTAASGPPILFHPWYPRDREIDTETSDGRKIKIKVRYVMSFSEDSDDEA